MKTLKLMVLSLGMILGLSLASADKLEVERALPQQSSGLEFLKIAQVDPMNCVNAGGSCNGTVPCCQDSFCIRNRCQVVPENPYVVSCLEK